MKNILIIALVVFGGYQLYNKANLGKITPEYDRSYVVVYGRDACGWTSRMRKSLAAKGIDFEYRKIDDRLVADNVHQRMESAGIDTSRYLLPVVEVNGNIQARPEFGWVIEHQM